MATNKKSQKKPIKKSAKKAAKKNVKVAPKKSAKKTASKPTKKLIKKSVVAKKTAAPQKVKSTQSFQKPTNAKSQKWAAIFVPLDDRILVRAETASDKTPGGLFIPMSAEERPNRGAVLSVGRGHRDKKGRIRPLDVKVGDSVLYSAYAGTKTMISGEEFLILREADVLGVVS